jgi:hypothetical protein
MFGHIRETEWVDVLSEGGDMRQRQHLEDCVTCRQSLDDIREGLTLARMANVPEPSPLYWDIFRRRVGERIAGEHGAPSRAVLSLRWVLTGALAVGLLLSAVTLRRGSDPTVQPSHLATVLPAWAPLPPAEADEGLSVLAALDSADLEAATCRDMALCLADASDTENAQLAKALEEEMKGHSL